MLAPVLLDLRKETPKSAVSRLEVFEVVDCESAKCG